MFGWLAALFNSVIYVGISRRELLVREATTGQSLRWPAAIAVDAGKVITAVGAGATSQPSSQVHWPFDHPRIVIADFQLAEKLLQAALREMTDYAFLRPSPILLLHALEAWEAGLSQIERRALKELGFGAGAREVFLWRGTPPSSLALQSGEFRRSPQLMGD